MALFKSSMDKAREKRKEFIERLRSEGFEVLKYVETSEEAAKNEAERYQIIAAAATAGVLRGTYTPEKPDDFRWAVFVFWKDKPIAQLNVNRGRYKSGLKRFFDMREQRVHLHIYSNEIKDRKGWIYTFSEEAQSAKNIATECGIEIEIFYFDSSLHHPSQRKGSYRKLEA